jgi:hypothetical protein
MMKHKKFDFRTAYIDLLLNILTGIIFLFILTTLLIQPQKKSEDAGIKKNAEMILTASWDGAIDCDVDLWIQDPLGNLVSFQMLSKGLMNIERDDMGFKNDYIYNPTGNLILASKDNREIWTLRGKQEGRFTVNLHLYSCRIDNIPLQLYEKIDVPVVIELVRLNPYLNTVTTEVVTLNSIWDEKTAFSFVIDKNGYIRFERNFIKLVKDKRP